MLWAFPGLAVSFPDLKMVMRAQLGERWRKTLCRAMVMTLDSGGVGAGSGAVCDVPMGCSIPIIPSEAQTLAGDIKPMPGLEHLTKRQREIPFSGKQQGGKDLDSIREEFQSLSGHQALPCINLIWKEW